MPAAAVGRGLDELRPTLTGTVAEAYRAHDAGQTVNPASGFLRFPSTPDARIISLWETAGLLWPGWRSVVAISSRER